MWDSCVSRVSAAVVLTLSLYGCSVGGASRTASTVPKSSTTLRPIPSTVARTGVLAPSSTRPVQPASTTPIVAATPAGAASGPVDTSAPRPPATSAGRVGTKPNDNVGLGDTGSGVKQIQAALASNGYKVSADGEFGTQTEQAVKAFQGKNGLKADGIVGAATWAKLQVPASSTARSTTTTMKGHTTTTKH